MQFNLVQYDMYNKIIYNKIMYKIIYTIIIYTIRFSNGSVCGNIFSLIQIILGLLLFVQIFKRKEFL